MLCAYSRMALPKTRGELRLDVLQRVDAEAVNVVLGDQVLMGADEGVAHREVDAAFGSRLAKAGDQFLEGVEVAGGLLIRGGPIEGVAAASHELVTLQLSRPDRGVAWRIGRQFRPVGPAVAVRVPPADRVGRIIAPRRQAAGRAIRQRILEHVTHVVEHNVKDHVDASVVRRIDQRPQFGLDQRRILPGCLRVRCEPGIDRHEVVDAVAVIARFELAVLHDRR